MTLVTQLQNMGEAFVEVGRCGIVYRWDGEGINMRGLEVLDDVPVVSAGCAMARVWGACR